MESNVIRVGDPPVAVHGTYAIHAWNGGGAGTLTMQNTHFIADAGSWTDVVNLSGITNGGVVIELVGHIQLTGVAGGKASYVQLGGRGSGGFFS